MRPVLLEVLACPQCQESLELKEPFWAKQEILSGTLLCNKCHMSYPILDSVPRLFVNGNFQRRERNSFNFQWNLRFNERAEPDDILWGQGFNQLNYKVNSKCKWYMDAGCGSGEIIENVAKNNQQVQAIGFDFSDSIKFAHVRNMELTNLHYVQGDMLNPPFKKGCVQFILSLGVMHHISDTEKALKRTCELLDNKGILSFWLYPNLQDLKSKSDSPEYKKWKRYYFFRDKIFLKKAYLLNHKVLFSLCMLLSFFISPFIHILNYNIKSFKIRYLSNSFILFDNLSPVYQHRYNKKQIYTWLNNNGINQILYNTTSKGLYTIIKK